MLGKTRDPNYGDLAKEKGYRNFYIDDEYWLKMTEGERWKANKKFLDRAIEKGNKIELSHNPSNLGIYTGTFKKEIDYLKSKGFKISDDGRSMVKK